MKLEIGSARGVILALALGGSLVACQAGPRSPEEAWRELRQEGARAQNAKTVAHWLLSELVSPGGNPESAQRARKHLDELDPKDSWAQLARGIDDMMRGRPEASADALLTFVFEVSVLAPGDTEGDWDLLAWFAAQKAYELSGHLPKFDERHAARLDRALAAPGPIGFRAYATLVDLWARREARKATKDIDGQVASRLGCIGEMSFAGPFGRGLEADALRSFAPEKPGPWPRRFQPEFEGARVPERYEADVVGCDASVKAPRGPGVFYAQTFVELDAPEELILTAAGALEVWVDDVSVLRRELTTWGVWPKYGVRLGLEAGVHRVVWKLGDASSSLRLMRPDGRPLVARAFAKADHGYTMAAPRTRPDPNALLEYVRDGQLHGNPDDLTRFVAATMADYDGVPDVATVLLDPLVKSPEQATGVVLMTAATFIEGDPIFDATQTRDLMHELFVRSAEKDRGLWFPRYSSALWEAGQRGKVFALKPLSDLAHEFPEVPTIGFTLASFYEELEWGPELEATVALLLERYPSEPDAIAYAIDVAEARGDSGRVDALLTRLLEENPDTEVLLGRALKRRDYEAAHAELERLVKRRPERKDIAERITDLLIRSGDAGKVWQRLEQAVEREPRDVHARLALADAELSSGKKDALARALVDAIKAGGDPSVIQQASELVEGMSALDRFRLDAKEVIAEYEAKGTHQPGTAARVLDYGALLVRSDGSNQFLEHQVVLLQSEEGVRQFAEMDAGGRVLHLRVLKRDGRILEPEVVSGKPTVTMPHLEIGDYIELERIVTDWNKGSGRAYIGPTWFFREENVAYARSEFVVLSPRDKKLLIESVNDVPEPTIEDAGPYVARRFRMDDSPAATPEPNSPPLREFVPRVSVGWGLDPEERLERIAASMISLAPTDPRLLRIAERIVVGVPASNWSERARRLYHWVLENVQEGDQSDGRQVVVSRNGNRARGFETLCRALSIPVRWAVAQSRLSSPTWGPISEFEKPLFPLLVVGPEKQAVFLTIEDRFAPFGTVPSHLRGEQAYLLGAFEPQSTRVPTSNLEDGIVYKGKGRINEDGDADLELSIVFQGSYATSLRNGLAQIPENQLEGIIEAQFLGQFLQGARLLGYKVQSQADLDKPLVLNVRVRAPRFASRAAGALLVTPPFMPRLSQLTSLATRKTPLLIGERVHQGLELELELPSGYSAEVYPKGGRVGGSSYRIEDKVLAEPGRKTPAVVELKRTVTTDAGRIAASKYLEFQEYTQDADAALTRAVRLRSTP